MGSPNFGDYLPKTLELDLDDGRKLKLLSADPQDVADGEEVIGKPYDEWWDIRTRKVFKVYEEDDPEGRWKAGDDVLEDGQPVIEEATERTTTLPIMSTMCWLMARKVGLSAEQIDNEEWPWTLKQFRRQFSLKQFAAVAGDVLLFFYAAVDAAMEVEPEPDTSTSESETPVDSSTMHATPG